MKKELENKLFSTYPLLYGDRTKPMHITCMYWGIECESGWYSLLNEASAKIEPILEKIEEETYKDNCYNCGCSFYLHRSMPSKQYICKNVHKLPYFIGSHRYGCILPEWKKRLLQAWTNEWDYKQPNKYKVNHVDKRIKRLLNYFLIEIKKDWAYTKFRNLNQGLYKFLNKGLRYLSKIGINYKKPCFCNRYETSYPRATQIKEKYGTLRFYMSSTTEEIQKIITLAEIKSAKTCQTCGKTGKLRSDNWNRTLCNKCEKQYSTSRFNLEK